MDTVVCTNPGMDTYLTFGKTYVVEERVPNTDALYVLNDIGEKTLYHANRFESPSFIVSAAEPEVLHSTASQVAGDHYMKGSIQPIEFILANEHIGFVEGNVIKYVFRWKNKHGLDDLRKAKHYLDILIEHEEKKNNG